MVRGLGSGFFQAIAYAPLDPDRQRATSKLLPH